MVQNIETVSMVMVAISQIMNHGFHGSGCYETDP